MKTKKMLYIVGLLIASMAFACPVLMAGEHGGSTMQEHGGTAMEGSHHEEGSSGMSAQGDAAVLKEAAGILKANHPELAAKLEAIAKKHQ